MNVKSTLILHSISLSRAFSLYVHLVQELEWYLDMGFYISVSGVVCKEDRGAPLREILPLVPDNRLMVETDAPYLGTNGRERMTYICSVFKQHSHLAVVARPSAKRCTVSVTDQAFTYFYAQNPTRLLS